MDQAAEVLQSDLALDSRIAIFAEQQTKGRGRYERSWDSPVGNIYLSLMCRPNQAIDQWAQLSFVTALAVRNFLADQLSSLPQPPQLCLKWPNDVLLDNQKISGILLEIKQDNSGQSWIVIGMGVNLVSAPSNIPYPATYLKEYISPLKDQHYYQTHLLECFDNMLKLWENQGFEAIRTAWLSYAAFVGETIQVKLPHEIRQGKFTDLDASGRLLLEQADGSHFIVSAGDVFFSKEINHVACH